MKPLMFWIKCVCTATCLLLPAASFCQRNYIATDSALTIGVKPGRPFMRNDSMLVRVQAPGRVSIYSPYDLKEFASGGKFYKALNIGNERYFFERLVNGKMKLFFLPVSNSGKFYVQEGDRDSLQLIPDEETGRVMFLSRYVHGSRVGMRNVKHMKNNRTQLIHFFRNAGRFPERPIPRMRYGLNGGVTLNKFTAFEPSLLFSNADFQYSTGYFAGPFVDLPLDVSYFSLEAETAIHSYGSSTMFTNDNVTRELIVNQLCLNSNLSVKYSFYRWQSVPFLAVGLVHSFMIQDEGMLYSYTKQNDDVFVDTTPITTSPESQVGYTIGTGITFNYGARYGIRCKVNYNEQSATKKFLGRRQIVFSLGFVF
jgi:hypothetical protein